MEIDLFTPHRVAALQMQHIIKHGVRETRDIAIAYVSLSRGKLFSNIGQ
jgi:hypothetical protein